MVNAQRRALEKLWKDRCWIFRQEEHTDPVTKITSFLEKPLLEDLPCKLSFEALSSTGGDEVPITSQAVKLFISPDVVVPAGCKIAVKRLNDLEREFIYSKSGEAGVFTSHQEINLTLFKGYA